MSIYIPLVVDKNFGAENFTSSVCGDCLFFFVTDGSGATLRLDGINGPSLLSS